MKILYCIAGIGYYGVLESDIEFRDGFTIEAKRVFSVEANPSQVIRSPEEKTINYIISSYKNVVMNCTFISDMSEDAPLYQKIVEIVKKEIKYEN